MFSEYLSIGEVLKPQGVRGQVKVRPDTNDPARFAQLQQVYIRQDNAYAAWPISDVSVRDGYVYCTLNHAQTRDDAEKQLEDGTTQDRTAHEVSCAAVELI